MLSSFKNSFDYSDFEKKVLHYFTDSAPIYADIELRLNEINVAYNGKLIHVPVDEKISVKENIKNIIKYCEESLYPKMIEVVEKGQYGVFTTVQIQEMLFQGLTLEQIHKKENNKIINYFLIKRFNTGKNTIDFREESTGNVFRAFLKRPLITSRDYILQLAEGGQVGMNKLYYFIMDNSRIEELEEKDAQVPTNFN